MRHFDLAIIGSGSAATIVGEHKLTWDIAVIEEDRFGGTCLNYGCIPSKMYVYAADVARHVRDAEPFGIDAVFEGARWPDIRDRIFGRIDPKSAAGRTRTEQGARTTYFPMHAEFSGPNTLRLSDGEEVSADRIVIGTGGRPVVPEPIARSGVPFHTSQTIMRLAELPRRLVIVGGGYIAAEMAHIFTSLGSAVTVVTRGPGMLRTHDIDVYTRFEAAVAQRWRLLPGVEVTGLVGEADAIDVQLSDGVVLQADTVLVATGRQPNSDRLNLAATSVKTDDDGRIVVDEFQRTTQPGVWALGDVSSPFQLKHVANHEARIVSHNIGHPETLKTTDHRFVPSAVFSDPQIASVGLTERAAAEQGLDFVTATQLYADTAFGWAMEDATGFCKLIADRATGRLVGAHVMGPQASTLIQPLVQAMSFYQPVRELARGQYWIHPALTEVVENALLKLHTV